MVDEDRNSSPLVTKVNIGDVLDGKYRIVRSLGRGAWGHVYEGANDRIGRRLAIKVLHPEYVERRDMLERFEREARTATKIESEHVVRVLDLGTLQDGRPYIVMEFLDGEDLGQYLARVKTIEPVRAAIIGIQALRGLAEAHAEDILHRDIKPDNIVLVKTRASDRIAKIVDFGISKLAGTAHQSTSMTATGAVLGSPMYMSPEQCRGARRIDARSDLYSLGVVLYESVTGRMPYDAETFNELMFKIALEDVPDPRTHRADLDPGFSAIVMRALQREADKLFETAEEFHDELANWLVRQGLQESDWRLGSSRNAGGGASGSNKVPLALRESRTANDSSPDLTDSRGAVARTATGSRTLLAPEPAISESALSASTKPPEKKSRATSLLIAAVLALAAVGLWVNRDREKQRTVAPEPTTTPTLVRETPILEPLPTASANATASAVASAPAPTASAEPDASAPAIVRRPGATPRPVEPRLPSGASAAAAPAASPPAASATPSHSATVDAGRGVIEGRTIRTTL